MGTESLVKKEMKDDSPPREKESTMFLVMSWAKSSLIVIPSPGNKYNSEVHKMKTRVLLQ